MSNQPSSYAASAIWLHWLMALLIFGLFALGLWMVELTYYSSWYQTAPALHEALGLLVALMWLVRIVSRWRTPPPEPLGKPIEKRLAKVAHLLMYALILGIVTTGYLISGGDGRAIDVFGLFSVPGIALGMDNQADMFGDIHYWLAVSLIALVILHTLAAFKHQLLDRDGTLLRMLPHANKEKQQ